MTDNSLSGLQGFLRGKVITRDDEEAFASARFRGWNRDLNRRSNPLGFVVVSGVRDIVTTVNYCRESNVKLAVRGKGAHSPYGMANDAVVIDLMNMTAVRVDPDRKRAFIQAGANGGDIDHETALYNLICITGSVSHTGFAGVALGGGIGHLSRWLGPVVDSIVGYEMVTAKGEVIRVDAEKDPELFWGMRGNGANFGIVTEFVLKLHDIPNDGIIRSAPILWPDDDDAQRSASKKWCDDTIAALGPFHVATYLNYAMPASDEEMRGVFPEETITRLRNLKRKHDPDGMFRAGAWDYQANV